MTAFRPGIYLQADPESAAQLSVLPVPRQGGIHGSLHEEHLVKLQPGWVHKRVIRVVEYV